MSGWERSQRSIVRSPRQLNNQNLHHRLLTVVSGLMQKDICANKKIISSWLRLESTTSVVQLIHIGVKIRKVSGFATDFFFLRNPIRLIHFVAQLWPNAT